MFLELCLLHFLLKVWIDGFLPEADYFFSQYNVICSLHWILIPDCHQKLQKFYWFLDIFSFQLVFFENYRFDFFYRVNWR